LRQKRNLTVRALAEKLGKTPGYLSRVEAREEIPAPDLICRIAEELNETPEALLDLAKHDLMDRTKDQIERKSSEALNLFRRSRK
jgi:transcriptional regulator with XRE-family HTH domain